ncbi:Rieske (2Fe-2S) protein [Streptomyces sp. NPDC058001]|uniref:Rieske (2Fe-2S) protein n=1 Tax=Streptomyces sp. NPDC058001 TaxID=3346300 RepID=UPI0036E1693B
MSVTQESVPTPSRRTVVTAVGAAGLAAALTACGSSDDSQSAGSAQSDGGASSDAGNGGGNTAGSPSGNASADGGAGASLAKTSDIPVGGGKIFGDEGVVVTQPTQGDFKAFSNRCTHAQCPVTSIEGGTINCPCHGSKFSIADGSVVHDPATTALPPKQIKVTGEEITLA